MNAHLLPSRRFPLMRRRALLSVSGLSVCALALIALGSPIADRTPPPFEYSEFGWPGFFARDPP